RATGAAGRRGDDHSLNRCCQTATSASRWSRTTGPLDGSSSEAGSHNQHPYRRGVRLAEALDPVLQRRCRRAEVHDQDLVLYGVDLATQPGAELGQLALVQVAEEDAVLHVIALALEGLEDGVAAAVVGDVVRDKIVSAGHGVTPPDRKSVM